MKQETEYFVTPIGMAMIAFSEIALETTSKKEQINLLAVCKTLETILEYESEYINSKIEIARAEAFIKGTQKAFKIKLNNISKN
jgi:hypothetical protein